MRTRRFWGWGYEDDGPDPTQLELARSVLAHWLGAIALAPQSPPRLDEIALRAPRIRAPATLTRLVRDAPADRAGHSYGKSYRDIVRAYARAFDNPPDLVAYPETEADVVALLDWCQSETIAAIPYGGGSSFCGGVEPDVGEAFRGAVSIDLGRLDRVLEIDRISLAAKIQAGVLGPALEEQLRPHGLTLRHYPQSFELSTLGGWIATRSGGHFATLGTHIDDFVEALRVITPTGIVQTRRLPASGAGPSPERLFIGSEGALGIITEAWMRVQPRPRFRASAVVGFETFYAGAAAARALAQSGLYPANCRLLDAREALMTGVAAGDRAVLLIAFESADHALDAWIARAVECAGDHGGALVGSIRTSTGETRDRGGAAGAWRAAFLRMPYLRDALVGMSLLSETFETAVPWDKFEALHAAVTDAAERATRDASGNGGIVTCRLTHVYPDGAAPYFTVIAPARRGAELAQWAALKSAITDAMLASGGTVTHHHAVGRDVRPFYERERPEGFGRALAAVKNALDPAGVLNPGVLLPART